MGHNTSNEQTSASDDVFEDLSSTIRTLVWPGGCAWHADQTHETLTPYLIEEAAELVDAIERNLPMADLKSELGDVLYQVLFHAAIAERDGEGFELKDVVATLNAKLIGRHPHVFGDRGHMTVEELNQEWERLKEAAAGERLGSRGVLEGIPAGMPSLARAAKVIERLKRSGVLEPTQFVGLDVSQSLVDEYAGVSPQAAADINPTRSQQVSTEDELGEAFLMLVARANVAGVDPDRALRRATERLAVSHAVIVEE